MTRGLPDLLIVVKRKVDYWPNEAGIVLMVETKTKRGVQSPVQKAEEAVINALRCVNVRYVVARSAEQVVEYLEGMGA